MVTMTRQMMRSRTIYSKPMTRSEAAMLRRAYQSVKKELGLFFLAALLIGLAAGSLITIVIQRMVS